MVFDILGFVHCRAFVFVRVRIVQMHRLRLLAKPHVEDLNEHGERHREINGFDDVSPAFEVKSIGP